MTKLVALYSPVKKSTERALYRYKEFISDYTGLHV